MKVFESLLEMFDKGLCLGFGETRDIKDHVIVLEDVSNAKTLGMNGAKAKEIDGIGAAVGGGEDVARVARIGWIEKEIGNLGAGDSLHLLLCELVEDKEMAINALALFASQCGLIVRLCGRDQQFFALCGVCHVKVSDQIDALLRDTAMFCWSSKRVEQEVKGKEIETCEWFRCGRGGNVSSCSFRRSRRPFRTGGSKRAERPSGQRHRDCI